MFVYRIENEWTQNGPYSTDAMTAYERHASAHAVVRHPPPYDDGLAQWREWQDHRFGFASIAALVEWFHHTEGRIAMARRGWKPYKFAINGRGRNVRHGKRQLTFNRAVATRVAELDPATLEEKEI